jgi:hypothetical protein
VRKKSATFDIVENIPTAVEKSVVRVVFSIAGGFAQTVEPKKPLSAPMYEERLFAITDYERARSLRFENLALR